MSKTITVCVESRGVHQVIGRAHTLRGIIRHIKAAKVGGVTVFHVDGGETINSFEKVCHAVGVAGPGMVQAYRLLNK